MRSTPMGARRSLWTVSVAFCASAICSFALFGAASAARAHIAPLHTHYPEVRHTVFEQFGVTATQTKVKSRVTQDNKPSIGTPAIVSSQCYHSSFPTWHTMSCVTGAFKSGTGASGYAQTQISARFYHSTGVDYTMHSWYRKRASEGDTFYRGITSGSLPWFWSDHCYAYLDGAQVGDY